MGIRIRKFMGYGLTDIKTDTHDNIVDKRFNHDGIIFKDAYEQEEQYKDELFFEHCKQVVEQAQEDGKFIFDLFQIHAKEFKQIQSVLHMLTYEKEGGLSNVAIITPFLQHTWQRYDDSIDYYQEQTQGRFEMESHVEILTVPLYPYMGYINRETGEMADSVVGEWIYQFRWADNDLNKEDGKGVPYETAIKSLDRLYSIRDNSLEKLGCESHWMEKWNVQIPEQVIEFCRFTKMFNDDKTIYSLLPMIYTHWS